MACKICNQVLNELISFGQMPLANGFLKQEEFSDEYFFELACGWCPNCKMFQLLNLPDHSQMFHEQYAFYTSTSSHMARHFELMALQLMEQFITDKEKAFVVELGSNDGTMLKHFAKNHIRHLGIEPSGNTAEIARKNGVNTKTCFFNNATAKEIKEAYGPADIISVANVHFANMHEVAQGVAYLLKPEGVFIFENPYIGNVIQNLAYDQIYDEHSFLFGLNSTSYIFDQYGLELFHVESQDTHGGSMRYFFGHQGQHAKRQSVTHQFEIENTTIGLDKLDTYLQFARKCENQKQSLYKLLEKLHVDNKKVVGYAATAKSTTILNYCNIGPDLIQCIYDTTPLKQGKFSPGMHIPIEAYNNQWWKDVDYAVLFAWNHAKEIFEKETAFKEKGGKWILFLPEIHFI